MMGQLPAAQNALFYDFSLEEQRRIVLNGKAGGATLSFSRFHPGNKWISKGNSGGQYIDGDIDTNVNLSDMWFTYNKNGKTESTKIDKVEVISQTSASN